MQEIESKQWTRPTIVVRTIDEGDIVTVSGNDILVTDGGDDAEVFKGLWYEN